MSRPHRPQPGHQARNQSRPRAPRAKARRGARSNPPVHEHGRFLALAEEHGWDYRGQRDHVLSFERDDSRSLIGRTALHLLVDDDGLVERAWHVGLDVPAVEGVGPAHTAALAWLAETRPEDEHQSQQSQDHQEHA